MPDLKTKYLGLDIKNPLVASASSISKKLSNIKSMEDAGISCVVLHSLFEEEINHESLELHYFLSRGTESFAEALTYFPEFDDYKTGADRYLDLIREAKNSVDIPIIGSLNGISNSGWINYAKKIEEAGADALELNIYYLPTEKEMTCQSLEKSYLDLVKTVKDSIGIPVAVKLSPYFTSLPNFLKSIVEAGANGLVLFNRFYQPDLDIEKLTVEPSLHLSKSSDMLLPLRWAAILFNRIKADIALSSGVHTGEDMVKAVMAGASVTMIASELVENGIQRAESMLLELGNWMDIHGYESIDSLRGILSQKSVAFPAAFERANYMKALTQFDERI
jgi:dihydroorotate dehydrogenase (fumarate)